MTRDPGVRRVLVVADDLTGASDTGVQFAGAGWSTVLRFGPGEPASAAPPGSTVAVSADSRALGADDALAATAEAISTEALDGTDRLYLKIDSTLRGSVAAQVAGALAVRRRTVPDAVVVLSPAYPAMGRTVQDGRLLVHGEPVSASPAGRDPVTPVRVDTVAEIVPGAVPVAVRPTAAAWADALLAAGDQGDVLAVDATTDDDLVRLAEAVDLLGARAVPAGSAGLAAPLAARWWGGDAPPQAAAPAVRRPLFLLSSHHAVARGQVAALAHDQADVTLVETQVDALLGGQELDAPGSGSAVLLSPHGRAGVDVAPALAVALAGHAARWLTAPRDALDDRWFDAVVLVGGDGAEAFLGAVGAHGIEIHGRLAEGVPHGRIAGGPCDGLPVVTKAGGFGDDTTLTTVLRTLRSPIGSESR